MRMKEESLLVLSDVHLGSDLNDFGHPIRRSRVIDEDLVKLITHYRTVPPPSERWRLVVAGDFIDFVGMAVRAAGVELATERSDEERQHGLGNAVDHVRVKLGLVVERHRAVFDALARFVADGHALAFIHGNHDLEFHWDAVKDDLRFLLLARARTTQTDAIDGPAFESRIVFHPWFFYVAGLAYIEHGHQYDAFCASEYVMAPLSATDPRRIARSVSDVLLRFVVRPTLGMREYGHDKHGVAHYLLFAMRLGVEGLLRLTGRYASAVGELFRLRREQRSGGADSLRDEHNRGMAVLASATWVGADRMRALAALQVPPVTRTIGGILASVLLDRLALGFAALPHSLARSHPDDHARGAHLVGRSLHWPCLGVGKPPACKTSDCGPAKTNDRARCTARQALPCCVRRDGSHSHAGEGGRQRRRSDLYQCWLVGRRRGGRGR